MRLGYQERLRSSLDGCVQCGIEIWGGCKQYVLRIVTLKMCYGLEGFWFGTNCLLGVCANRAAASNLERETEDPRATCQSRLATPVALKGNRWS